MPMSNQNQSQLTVFILTKQNIKEQSWQFLITIALCILIGYFLGPEYGFKSGYSLLSIHASFLLSYYFKKNHAAFMRKFAQINKLSYQAEGDQINRHGKLFQHQKKGRLFNLISGTILNFPTELYNYSFESGMGKRDTKHAVTVLQINFNGLVPRFTVLERNETIDSILRWRNGEYEHELEGDFYKYFKLYISNHEETEILEILTPEIMAFMIDEARHLSFEFTENQLYIYQDHYISNSKDLDKFTTLARMLLTKLQKRISRLHDDVAAIRSTTGKL
ncbi:MAG: hypothetical protein KAZ30_04635 [Candidatus Magasanikbacteria bacterium]|nr:hypothetical protein [Candidatus Magasanikbacteria bacterium]